MSQELMRAYCADRLQTAIGASYPDILLQFENHRFEQPKAVPFISMELNETGSMPASTGSRQRFYRTFELLSFVLHWPENTGTKRQGECAEFLKDLFQGRTVALSGGVTATFLVGKTVTQGLSNGFFRKVVMIPGWRDQSKPPAS